MTHKEALKEEITEDELKTFLETTNKKEREKISLKILMKYYENGIDDYDKGNYRIKVNNSKISVIKYD